MRRGTILGVFIVVTLVFVACGRAARDQAVFTCRQAGYLGAVEDGGVWYCWKDRLGAPQLIPPSRP